MPKYKVIDFKGVVHWAQRDDGTYAVDPLYEVEFLKFYNENHNTIGGDKSAQKTTI